jgi:hypothetical protein
MPVYHPKTMCDVNNLKYDFDKKCGNIDIVDWHVTDLSGTVAVFNAIDENVEEITVTAGGKPDILYRKKNGIWDSLKL